MAGTPVNLPDFKKRYGSWALVVGGSDGLGAEFARAIAASGVNCVLVARRKPVLDALAEELRADHGVEVRTASIDLENEDAARALGTAVAGLDLGLVVFNAGAEASGQSLLSQPFSTWKAIMRRNVDTLTEALYNFSGYFKARKRGGMIVIGSHASFAGCGRAAIYTATKGYAHNFAESMWAELKPHGVDVLSFVFAVADTATLRAVLARKNVPLESVNATPPADLAHAALNALPNGPTYVWGYAADSDDTMRGANIRRLTVEAHTNGMVAYYGEEDEA